MSSCAEEILEDKTQDYISKMACFVMMKTGNGMFIFWKQT